MFYVSLLNQIKLLLLNIFFFGYIVLYGIPTLILLPCLLEQSKPGCKQTQRQGMLIEHQVKRIRVKEVVVYRNHASPIFDFVDRII